MNNEKCKYCKWYKIGNAWCSMCMNENSEWHKCECIEADTREPQDCEDRESEEE